MAVPKNLFNYIWRELPVFWKYGFLVVICYALVFFFSSFSILMYALDFLSPLVWAGLLLLVFRVVIGWRKWQHGRPRSRRI